MKKQAFLWSIFWVMILPWLADGQVRLSEIMFNPSGSEFTNEFIEIFNLSATDTVDLNGWRVGDEKALDRLADAGEGLQLPPKCFALILDPDYFGNSTQYDSLIPASALVVTIGDKSFGSGGLSNSVAEQVVLVNARGDTVDTCRYSVGNPNGFSDEKVNLFQSSNSRNWKNSLVFNGTPGFRNSVALRSSDLALERVQIDSSLLVKEKQLNLLCTVKNVGLQVATNFQLALFLDQNLDGHWDEKTELVQRISCSQQITPGDSIEISFAGLPLPSGFWLAYVQLIWLPDENEHNNHESFSLRVPFEKEALVFTEIMYRPRAGEPEWVELQNGAKDSLLLYAWFFSDENTGEKHPVFKKPIRLPPSEYVVLAEDSLPGMPEKQKDRICVLNADWPVLNNSGDEVHLWGPAGEQIAQASYTIPEVPIGFSLEKVQFLLPGEKTNQWQPSRMEGGTPWRTNSVTPLATDGAIAAGTVGCATHAPFGQSPKMEFLLRNCGQLPITSGEIRVFLEEAQSEPVFLQTQQVQKRLLPGDSTRVLVIVDDLVPGDHHLRVEWVVSGDENTANNFVHWTVRCGFPKGTILLNEILYDPRPGWPEWVELMNPGTETISLQHWTLTDTRRKIGKSEFPEGTFISPKGFLVVTGDSLFFSDYPGVPAKQVCVAKDFPYLGNSADSLYLVDLAGGIVDWLAYRSSWGGQNGHSLERIRPENPARDSTNWSSSVANLGATPAKWNSIYLHVHAGNALLSISPNPFSPDGDGKDDFVMFTIRSPWATAQADLILFDEAGREVRRLLQNRPIGSSFETLWDGRDEQQHLLPVGLYIAFLQIFKGKMERKSTKKVFVLAHHK